MKHHYEIRFLEVMEELNRTKKELETMTRRWNRARRAYLKARAELEKRT